MTCQRLVGLPSYFPIAIIILALAVLVLVWRRITKYVFSRLEYSREFTDTGVFEGDSTILEETIINPTPFPIFFAEVEAFVYKDLEFADYIPDIDKNMQYMISRFTVMPYMKVRRRHNINCKKRGFYRLETARLWKGKKNRYFDSVASIYIYPKTIDSGIIPSPPSYLQGNYPTSRRLISDPFSFAGVRDYRFGDSFSSVNFKVTAKAPITGYSSIKVNSREFCSNRSIMIYLNFQTDSEDPIPANVYSSLMETSISFASSVVFEAVREGYKVGFAANSRNNDGSISVRAPMLSGNDHYISLLQSLSLMRTEAGASVISLFDKDIKDFVSCTEFYFMTTFINDEISEKISLLEKNTNMVSIIRLDRIFDIKSGGSKEGSV